MKMDELVRIINGRLDAVAKTAVDATVEDAQTPVAKGGRMRVEQSLLAESWNPAYAGLEFDPDTANPPFLKPAVAELAKIDRG